MGLQYTLSLGITERPWLRLEVLKFTPLGWLILSIVCIGVCARVLHACEHMGTVCAFARVLARSVYHLSRTNWCLGK